MTNRDAINLLEEVKILDDTMYAYNPKYLDALDMALTALEAEETWYATHEYPQKPHWIPCSERLPDKTTTVMVSCIDNSGDTPFSYTDCGYWVGLLPDDDPAWIVDGEVNYHVFAWMPLPEPYKEESEE